MSYFKKHKISTILIFLWFFFMIYITITGIKEDTLTIVNIISGIFAGLFMFVIGAIIITLITIVISKLFKFIHSANTVSLEPVSYTHLLIGRIIPRISLRCCQLRSNLVTKSSSLAVAWISVVLIKFSFAGMIALLN